MKCPSCGKEIAQESVFCEYCGTQLNVVKKGAEESVVHVRWLLLVSALLICFLNISFFYGMFIENAYDEYPYFDVSTLWIAPVFSLILFISSLILSIKNKLKFIYTILIFLVLGINTAIPIFAEDHSYGTVSYKVSVVLRENGEYVGELVGHNYDYDYAQRAEKVFNNMVTSSKYKYRDSRASYTDERVYYQAIHSIGGFATFMWCAEALVFLVYFTIALVACKREKTKNIII